MALGRDDQAIKERIGISLQETKLAEKLSVRETLELFRSFYEQGIEPEAAMREVSLEEKSTAWVAKLSGGQKQRLAVALRLGGRSRAAVSRRADDGARSAVAAAIVGDHPRYSAGRDARCC